MPMLRASRKAQLSKPRASFSVQPEEVAKVAYELYQQRGCQAGRELDDWLEAEVIVQRRLAANSNGNR